MKHLFIAILWMSFIFTATAQDQKNKPAKADSKANGQNKGQGKSPEEKAKKYTAELDSAVTLDDSQKAKITELVTQKSKEIKTIKDKYKSASGDKNANKKAAQEEIKPIKKKYQEEIRAVLREDQKVKYDSFVKNRKEQKKAKKGENQPEDDMEDDE